MKVEQALLKYGFNDKEAALYLCLLKHVELSVFELAQKTDIPRTTAYSTLEEMKKRGLVSSMKKNNVAHYTPENPKRLLAILKEKEELIQEIMPEMTNLIDSAGRNPTVKLYLGETGVKTVLEDVLETIEKEKLPVIQVVSQLDILEAFPRFFPDWQKRRHTNKNTFTQLIVSEAVRDKLPDLFKTIPTRETRFMPQRFSFQSSLEIYGTKTATISLQDGEYHSIIIDSPTVTNMFKQFFLATWGMLGGIASQQGES